MLIKEYLSVLIKMYIYINKLVFLTWTISLKRFDFF